MKSTCLVAIVVAVVGVFATSGCSSKPNCQQYATHSATVSTAGIEGAEGESRRRTVELSAKQACDAGRVSNDVVACVLAAKSAAAIQECELAGVN